MHAGTLVDGRTGGAGVNRRTLLKGLIAGAAGLVLPNTELVTGDEAHRQYWQLDKTMMSPPEPEVLRFIPDEGFRLESGKNYRFVAQWGHGPMVEDRSYMSWPQAEVEKLYILNDEDKVIAETTATSDFLRNGYWIEANGLQKVDPPREVPMIKLFNPRGWYE